MTDAGPGGKKRTVKLILVGDLSVGKTNLMLRFSDNEFKESLTSTVGIDFKVKTREYDGEKIKIQIWDTAGQDRFRSIAKNYFRKVHGVVLVFDVTNRASYNNINDWIKTVNLNTDNEFDLIVLGNKVDKAEARLVPEADARKRVEEAGYRYFETSAKDGRGVDEAFDTLVKAVLDRGGDRIQPTSLVPAQQPDDASSCSC